MGRREDVTLFEPAPEISPPNGGTGDLHQYLASFSGCADRGLFGPPNIGAISCVVHSLGPPNRNRGLALAVVHRPAPGSEERTESPGPEDCPQAEDTATRHEHRRCPNDHSVPESRLFHHRTRPLSLPATHSSLRRRRSRRESSRQQPVCSRSRPAAPVRSPSHAAGECPPIVPDCGSF